MYKIPANSLFIGKELVFMPECHSTNSIALDRCQQIPPPSEGTIVITDHQYAGRGQRGNVWTATPGENLTFSIILKPTFLSVADQFLLNVITALGVADLVRAAGCTDVAVKWPNDVYAGGKKICGILIESQIRGGKLLYAIVGIGLNINQKNFLISTTTSVSLLTHKHHDLNACLHDLVGYLEARYLRLRSGDKQELLDEYEANLYWAHELHEFESADRGRFQGSIAGVDPNGRLRIEVNGEEATFDVRQVSFIARS